jgi:hypothetical protein
MNLWRNCGPNSQLDADATAGCLGLTDHVIVAELTPALRAARYWAGSRVRLLILRAESLGNRPTLTVAQLNPVPERVLRSGRSRSPSWIR